MDPILINLEQEQTIIVLSPEINIIELEYEETVAEVE